MFGALKNAFSKFVQAVTTKELSEEELEEVFEELVLNLAEADVAFEVAEEIASRIKEELSKTRVPRFGNRKELVLSILEKVLLEVFSRAEQVDFFKVIEEARAKGEPAVILFVGPNGYGKTTTIAKIGKLLMSKGLRVLGAASDTFRAGAIEQLEKHAKAVGFDVVKHKYGADPAAVAYDAVAMAKARGYDVVLIDSAGRLHTDRNLMEELKKIQRVVNPHLTVFVADALLGSDALEQIRTYMKFIRVDAIVLTKVDADPKGGSAITLVAASKKPIVFVGTGQGYDDLEVFDPAKFVRRFLSELRESS